MQCHPYRDRYPIRAGCMDRTQHAQSTSSWHDSKHRSSSLRGGEHGPSATGFPAIWRMMNAHKMAKRRHARALYTQGKDRSNPGAESSEQSAVGNDVSSQIPVASGQELTTEHSDDVRSRSERDEIDIPLPLGADNGARCVLRARMMEPDLPTCFSCSITFGRRRILLVCDCAAI